MRTALCIVKMAQTYAFAPARRGHASQKVLIKFCCCYGHCSTRSKLPVVGSLCCEMCFRSPELSGCDGHVLVQLMGAWKGRRHRLRGRSGGRRRRPRYHARSRRRRRLRQKHAQGQRQWSLSILSGRFKSTLPLQQSTKPLHYLRPFLSSYFLSFVLSGLLHTCLGRSTQFHRRQALQIPPMLLLGSVATTQ